VVQALVADAAPRDEQQTKERDALRAFYERRDAEPLWVGPTGFNDRARALVAEFGRADSFGLNPADFALPSLDAPNPSKQDLANAEIALDVAVLKYARQAKGGRVDPTTVNHQLYEHPAVPEPGAVLPDIATTSDPSAYLRSLHPTHPQFVALREKLNALQASKSERSANRMPDGPVLRKGDTNDQVPLLRKRLGVANASDKHFDEALDTAVRDFQRQNGLTVDGIVGQGTRDALNGENADAQIVKILVNMERWRWLPDDLGGDAGIYVWANIPEFRVRVIKGNETLFDERAIVGKVDKQTPVFSDKMEWVEIHPTWYVPNSIKVEDILPSIRRPTSTLMERYDLHMDCGRYGRDPTRIDWSVVDIRNCSITQPPGDKSVLGDFKFKFPNDHDVYMHDTPSVSLFNRGVRTFSHGCIRVRNPSKMAEVLLGNDHGMTAGQIEAILDGPRRLHKEEFQRPVPVHITYFTTVIDENGAFKSLPDYYGHDRRLAEALTGKGEPLSVPASARPAPRVSEREERPNPRDNWRRRVLMMQN
jgi:murein L,D-transpeptidase YcbB/YkuD